VQGDAHFEIQGMAGADDVCSMVSLPAAATNLRSSMLVLSGFVVMFPLRVSMSVLGERWMPASISITAIFEPRSKPVSRV